MRTRRNKIDAKMVGTRKHECEICGFEYYKNQLIEQDGLLVCEDDYDDPDYNSNRRNEAR